MVHLHVEATCIVKQSQFALGEIFYSPSGQPVAIYVFRTLGPQRQGRTVCHIPPRSTSTKMILNQSRCDLPNVFLQPIAIVPQIASFWLADVYCRTTVRGEALKLEGTVYCRSATAATMPALQLTKQSTCPGCKKKGSDYCQPDKWERCRYDHVFSQSGRVPAYRAVCRSSSGIGGSHRSPGLIQIP